MAERYDCHYCKESLFGRKYVLREENPYCVKCYENLYSNTCEECKKSIGCSSRVGGPLPECGGVEFISTQICYSMIGCIPSY